MHDSPQTFLRMGRIRTLIKKNAFVLGPGYLGPTETVTKVGRDTLLFIFAIQHQHLLSAVKDIYLLKGESSLSH